MHRSSAHPSNAKSAEIFFARFLVFFCCYRRRRREKKTVMYRACHAKSVGCVAVCPLLRHYFLSGYSCHSCTRSMLWAANDKHTIYFVKIDDSTVCVYDKMNEKPIKLNANRVRVREMENIVQFLQTLKIDIEFVLCAANSYRIEYGVFFTYGIGSTQQSDSEFFRPKMD